MTRMMSVAIVLLAAGQARRMGGAHHKLLAEFDGVPLVTRMAKVAHSVAPGKTLVVTGHKHSEIAASLAHTPVEIVRNASYADGMASSIVAGFKASVASADGVMVMLADMPAVTIDDLQKLINAFQAAEGSAVVRAISSGKRGNPVILPRLLRDEVMKLTGDIGARKIIETCGLPIIDVEIGTGAHLDVDTPEAVIAAGGILKG